MSGVLWHEDNYQDEPPLRRCSNQSVHDEHVWRLDQLTSAGAASLGWFTCDGWYEAPEETDAPAEDVTHREPAGYGDIMPCCGLTQFEIPDFDAMTDDPGLVTCRPRREAAFFDAARHEAEHRLSSRMERG